MKIIRESCENVTRRYEFEINEEYIEEMNKNLTQYMQTEKHPRLTKELVGAVLSGRLDSTDTEILRFVVNKGGYYVEYLIDYINDYVNEDIWDAPSEILDGECEFCEDVVLFEANEEQGVNEYVQMTIADNEKE